MLSSKKEKKEAGRFGPYSFEEFMEVIKNFHGSAAPGLILGGTMVEMAKRQLPENVLYDAISETGSCLPDAIQLLTPCTVGNGWLKIVNLGLYALSLFNKTTGEGVRVFLDQRKLDPYGEIKNWYLKLKEKKDQDRDRIVLEMREAGENIMGLRNIRVKPELVGKISKGKIGICPVCNEAYPIKHGPSCLSCQGQGLYLP